MLDKALQVLEQDPAGHLVAAKASFCSAVVTA